MKGCEKFALEMQLTNMVGNLNTIAQNRPKLKNGDYGLATKEHRNHDKIVDGLRNHIFEALKMIAKVEIEG